MVIVRALKDVLSIKMKTRHDSFCDQFSRLFMTKMFLVASFLTGFDYFSDKVSCMVPKGSTLSRDFVHSVCWISGFFIYEEMKDRYRECAYYGIPTRIRRDGLDAIGRLCETKDQYEVYQFCKPMTRVYYVQYQWLPFYFGALGVLYYLPYIVFRLVNADLVSLKTGIKLIATDADKVVGSYFNYRINPIAKLRLRVWLNILVKLLYIGVNIFSFYATDYLLLGNYLGYGQLYVNWSKLNITEAHLKTRERESPKPGDTLLPSMGLCEIDESTSDIQTSFQNQNRFICELSPNILYQYVLIVLWFLFAISIAISFVGLIENVGGHIYNLTCFCKSSAQRTVYRHITLRESEYLNFVKKKNMVLYGEILRKLKQQRADLQGKFSDGFETSNGYL